MAKTYVRFDRGQPFLLPPSLQEWLPEDHLVWTVIELVDELDTAEFHRAYATGGAGRPAFDPDMMLGLLLYSYCMGERSSRQIERLCSVDVAYRVVCANLQPDHSTIARFRAAHEQALADVFAQVLAVCGRAGMVQVGTVALDGTKMAASAARSATRSRAQIEAEVARILEEAAATDAAEDAAFGQARGDEPPPELADPRTRRARLRECLRQLDDENAQREAAEEAAVQQRTARRLQRAKSRTTTITLAPRPRQRTKVPLSVPRAKANLAVAETEAAAARQRRRRLEDKAARQGRRALQGPVPDLDRGVDSARAELARAEAAAAERAAKSPINTTDLDSRLMKDRRGYLQAYNAQAVVSADGVIVAADVNASASDTGSFVPMVDTAQALLDTIDKRIGVVLADAGYWSEHNAAVPGPDRLIATTKAHKLRKAKTDPTARPPKTSSPRARKMEERLLSEHGWALYAKRSQTVEPIFGIIKEARGFRRFMRRGLSAARSEWKLIGASLNIHKLHRHRLRPT